MQAEFYCHTTRNPERFSKLQQSSQIVIGAVLKFDRATTQVERILRVSSSSRDQTPSAPVAALKCNVF